MLIQLVLIGDWTLVFFKSSPGGSNMQPRLRNTAIGRSESEADLASEDCFENTKPDLRMLLIQIKKV